MTTIMMGIWDLQTQGQSTSADQRGKSKACCSLHALVVGFMEASVLVGHCEIRMQDQMNLWADPTMISNVWQCLCHMFWCKDEGLNLRVPDTLKPMTYILNES